MARPREFNEVEAMNSAVNVFMAKGYQAASLMDLLKAMDLSKSSLYNSFGTKHELFLSAIDHYSILKERELKEQLETVGSAKSKIEYIFHSIVEHAVSEIGTRGNLLHNCAIEVLPQDPVAGEKISNGLSRLKGVYVEVIRHGQDSGEISKKYDAEMLGDLIISSIMGLLSFARATPDKNKLSTLSKMITEMIFDNGSA